MKNVTSQFSGMVSKPKPAPPARAKRRGPSPADLALAKYSGDPAIVAAHVAWGGGRLWPADPGFEQRACGSFHVGSDKIVGILGAATGGPVVAMSAHLSCFVFGFDWRSAAEVPAQEFIKAAGAGDKTSVRTINLDTVFPLQRKCEGMIAVEPVLTRSQDHVLDWLRLAISGGGQVILEEPSLEHQEQQVPKGQWFVDQENENCFWKTPAEREMALKLAGFSVQKVQETTGIALRTLRTAVASTDQAFAELSQATELAPILQPVTEFFKKEVDAAKNRLNALENGDVAVYRYTAIKHRVDG
ncbi:MAG: hypothetical protein COA47_06195 [Robiginitomaculum sp.]|nr:MAG: hypothetical protein COA47_06195 [Robiginitomaculum sp.]